MELDTYPVTAICMLARIPLSCSELSMCKPTIYLPVRMLNEPNALYNVGYLSLTSYVTPASWRYLSISCLRSRSSSMARGDRQPLPDAPATDRIREKANNRLGAVYSALYSFWSARHAAVTSGQQGSGVRRDAYSIILFDTTTRNAVVNDFTSTPDQLLDIVLNDKASGDTNFTAALQAGQAIMTAKWSTERFVF